MMAIVMLSLGPLVGPWRGVARGPLIPRRRGDLAHRRRRSCGLGGGYRRGPAGVPAVRACGATHVLLPDVCLLRRRDAVEVIGAAVLAATGMGYRRVAEQLGRPAETVRDWLARFRARAGLVASHCWQWARALDGAVLPSSADGSPVLMTVEAIGVCTRAASLVLGQAAGAVVMGVGADRWRVVVDQHESALACA
jgi:Homeodomain-like domain